MIPLGYEDGINRARELIVWVRQNNNYDGRGMMGASAIEALEALDALLAAAINPPPPPTGQL